MQIMTEKFYSRITVPLSLGLAALVWVALIAPGTALAHAKLVSSSPVENAAVATGLTSITLDFSEEISVDQSTAQVTQDDGTAVSGVTSAVDRADRKKMTVQTPPLTAGNYTVKWHAVTEDDNGISDGSFPIRVLEPADLASSSAPLPSTGSAENSALWAALAVVALLLAASGFMLRRKVR